MKVASQTEQTTRNTSKCVFMARRNWVEQEAGGNDAVVEFGIAAFVNAVNVLCVLIVNVTNICEDGAVYGCCAVLAFL